MKRALFMMAYGSPERKEDIIEYLRDVFGGREPPQFVIDETNRKYSRFGFRSPSIDILRKLKGQATDSIESADVYLAFKHWKPSIQQAVNELKERRYNEIYALPLFPIKSTSIQASYLHPLNDAMSESGYHPAVRSISGMSETGSLTDFWLESISNSFNDGDFLMFTAHSLPHTVEREPEYYNTFEGWSSRIAKEMGIEDFGFAFQSRGAYGKTWLEPSVYDLLEKIGPNEYKNIVTVPVGFLYDHLEVLYDLDYLFGEKVKEKGMGYKRAELPNNSELMVNAIKETVEMMSNE
ncbi:MAG: ferrochelatase [Candidatus Thermoplasmatota archaeon]|nr:ferrochelatase [Candidatus Thermoplasmatota archaeon]MCL5888929.1 ferrochelatase [Candidatus Thermoplasmatota archaeon]